MSSAVQAVRADLARPVHLAGACISRMREARSRALPPPPAHSACFSAAASRWLWTERRERSRLSQPSRRASKLTTARSGVPFSQPSVYDSSMPQQVRRTALRLSIRLWDSSRPAETLTAKLAVIQMLAARDAPLQLLPFASSICGSAVDCSIDRRPYPRPVAFSAGHCVSAASTPTREPVEGRLAAFFSTPRPSLLSAAIASSPPAVATRQNHTLARSRNDQRSAPAYSRLDVLGKWRYRAPPAAPSSQSAGPLVPPGGADVKDPSGEMKRAVEQVGDRGGASAGGKKRISIPFASHSEQPDAGSVNATATPMDSPAASSDRTQPLIVHGVTIPVKPKPPGEEGENLGHSISDRGMGLPSYLAGALTGCRPFSAFTRPA